MDTKRFLADLYAERRRVDAAIAALEALGPATLNPQSGRGRVAHNNSDMTANKRVLTPEGRERIAAAARKRWAKQRKAAKSSGKQG